jgi:hypothetical protein
MSTWCRLRDDRITGPRTDQSPIRSATCDRLHLTSFVGRLEPSSREGSRSFQASQPTKGQAYGIGIVNNRAVMNRQARNLASKKQIEVAVIPSLIGQHGEVP